MIEIGSYDFEGPFKNTSNLETQSGVYAILGRNSVNEDWGVIDIGESVNVRYRVENHDRAGCWKEQNYAILNCAAYYCNLIDRSIIETELRNRYNPPCGDR